MSERTEPVESFAGDQGQPRLLTHATRQAPVEKLAGVEGRIAGKSGPGSSVGVYFLTQHFYVQGPSENLRRPPCECWVLQSAEDWDGLNPFLTLMVETPFALVQLSLPAGAEDIWTLGTLHCAC